MAVLVSLLFWQIGVQQECLIMWWGSSSFNIGVFGGRQRSQWTLPTVQRVIHQNQVATETIGTNQENSLGLWEYGC